MFSMCSEPTPRARIPDTRIPQVMQPWYIPSLESKSFLTFEGEYFHCFWQIEKCIAKAFWALYGIGVEKPDAMNQTFMSFPALREYLLRNIASTHLAFFCDQAFIKWGNACIIGFTNIRILSFLYAHIVCVRTQCAMHTLACFCFLSPFFVCKL